MPEMPKNEPDKEVCKDAVDLAEDQKKRGYYYDDAHGYEPYVPDTDEGPEDAENDRD